MKYTYIVLVVSSVLGLALAIVAGKAAANSAAFAFTMERRAVHGKNNKKLHTLDAGELTLSGGIWVVSKTRSASSAPDPVEIRVKKDNLLDSDVCSASVTPSTTFNQKTSFEKSCGRIESGSYWIFVVRPNEDGWHLQGSGSLVTK